MPLSFEWEEGGLLIGNPGSAGVVTIYHQGWALHLGVRKEHRHWRHIEGWYDGPLHEVGLGCIALVTWMSWYQGRS